MRSHVKKNEMGERPCVGIGRQINLKNQHGKPQTSVGLQITLMVAEEALWWCLGVSKKAFNAADNRFSCVEELDRKCAANSTKMADVAAKLGGASVLVIIMIVGLKGTCCVNSSRSSWGFKLGAEVFRRTRNQVNGGDMSGCSSRGRPATVNLTNCNLGNDNRGVIKSLQWQRQKSQRVKGKIK